MIFHILLMLGQASCHVTGYQSSRRSAVFLIPPFQVPIPGRPWLKEGHGIFRWVLRQVDMRLMWTGPPLVVFGSNRLFRLCIAVLIRERGISVLSFSPTISLVTCYQ